MPIRKELNQDFFKSWTPEMAYVLGFFAADGSMLKNRRGGHFIEFTSTDRILLEHVRRVTGSSHAISERERPNPKWKLQYRLQIGSKVWFKDLALIGFSQKKSNTLKFPNVPDAYLGDFVRGYFDGDGCVYFNKLKYVHRNAARWVLVSLFTSGSKDFLESLHDKLRICGVQKGCVSRKQQRGFELKFSHRDSLALYGLMYNTCEVASPFLPRKREKLEYAIQVLRLDKELRS